MQHKNSYETHDLGLAAALRICGYKLIGFEPTDGRRIVFVFELDPSLDQTIQRFWTGQLPVDALSYFGSVKLLKAQIHSMA
ncbi:hypothetical protein FJZ48_00950 [Candidatus Uhrbacteria bacterium]|nr:hypothetical protein [Candidatus Uhrbacteria bacterium]